MIFILKMDNPNSPDNTVMPTRVQLVGPFPEDYAAPMDAWIEANGLYDKSRGQVVDVRSAEVLGSHYLVEIVRP